MREEQRWEKGGGIEIVDYCEIQCGMSLPIAILNNNQKFKKLINPQINIEVMVINGPLLISLYNTAPLLLLFV